MELAVTPGGDWRRLPATLPTAPTPEKPLWLQVHERDLLLSDGIGSTPVARGSLGTILRPEESLEAIGGSELPDLFRVTRGTNYLLVEHGKARYQQWRSAVGADDFGIMPPDQRKAALDVPHPDPPIPAGLVQFLVPKGEGIVMRRIALAAPSAPGNPPGIIESFMPNKVAESAAGDIVLLEDEGQLHQTGPEQVALYCVTGGSKSSFGEPLAPLTVFAGRPFLTAFTFFGAGTDAPSLSFVLAEQKRLRIFVSDLTVAKMATEVAIEPAGAVTGTLFVTAHELARYTNDEPGRVASSRVTITKF
jgi:hypothetical protein